MNLLLILASLVSLFHYNHPTVEKISKEENENIDPKIAKITGSKSISISSPVVFSKKPVIWSSNLGNTGAFQFSKENSEGA
jgi:hypothetical protein